MVAPLSVAGTLRTHLYDERTVVATSATLALGGRFDTVARAIGLGGATPEPEPRPARGGTQADPRAISNDADDDNASPPWQSLDVGSPFDYAKQGILYVAAHLPRPTQSGLPDAAAEELVVAGQRAGRPYPRVVLLATGGRARPRRCLRERTDLQGAASGRGAVAGADPAVPGGPGDAA